MQSIAEHYSIKDLERLSGIKAHTIRMWEQRYQLLCPERSFRNIRLYKDHDLKFLLNISVLIRNGGKISRISKLSQQEICQKIKELDEEFSSEDFFQMQCCRLLSAMLDLDENKFNAELNFAVGRFGFEQTMIQLLIPFLRKIGMMWRTGESTIIQEHFVCSLIRKKLCSAINELPSVSEKSHDSFLLFLPKDEYHEIGLLFSEYILKKRGRKVVYLGQSVPVEEILEYAKRYKPAYLLTFFTAAYSKEDICRYIGKISPAVFPSTFLMAGNPLLSCGLVFPDNTIHLKEVTDLILFAEHS